MEMQCEAARREASELRSANGNLVAEVNMLRDRLQDTENERRRWQHTSSTLLGRLLAINDTIAGAVKAALKDGYDAITPKDEPGEADAVAAAASQCAGAGEGTDTPERKEASPEPPQRILAAVPKNQFPTVDPSGQSRR